MRKIVRVLLFMVLTCFMIICLSIGMERKNNKGYYKEASEDIDVVFLGNSHVAYGIYPMDLWNKYGISSYNLGNNACGVPVSYWTLRQAIEYRKPKVAVINTSTVSSGWIDPNGAFNPYLLSAVDWMPIGRIKWDAVNDLCRNVKNRWFYLFNFSVYHSRWTDWKISELDDSENRISRGAGIWNNIAEPMELPLRMENVEYLSTVPGMGDWEYLRRTIELCQDNDIQVLLTYLPFPYDEASYQEAYTVNLIAEEYGVNYINFLECYQEVGIDFQTDCLDAGSHLNSSGVRKNDTYLGEYLIENYGIEDHRNDDEYQIWRDDYRIWKNNWLDTLKEQSNLDFFLMLLYDADFSYQVQISEDSIIWNEQRTMNYLEQLFPKEDMEKLRGNSVDIFQNTSQYEDAFFEKVSLTGDKANSDIRIWVYDNETGECVCSKTF